MQSTHTLAVKRREKNGTRYAKRDREAGRLPAVLYGHGRPPVSLTLDAKEAIRFFNQGEKVFNIELSEEGKTQTVLLKDIQFDYLGTNIIHVDLARVDLDEEVESHAHIHLVGEARGLKRANAILTHPTTSITIRCSVRNIPEEIRVNIADLDVGQQITAGDVVLPEGVKLLSDPSDLIASINTQIEEVVEGEAAAVGAEEAQPEVIKKKKDDEEEGD